LILLYLITSLRLIISPYLSRGIRLLLIVFNNPLSP